MSHEWYNIACISSKYRGDCFSNEDFGEYFVAYSFFRFFAGIVRFFDRNSSYAHHRGCPNRLRMDSVLAIPAHSVFQ